MVITHHLGYLRIDICRLNIVCAHVEISCLFFVKVVGEMKFFDLEFRPWVSKYVFFVTTNRHYAGGVLQ